MSVEKIVEGGGVLEKPTDESRVSPEESEMFIQYVNDSIGEISAMIKGKVQLMNNKLDDYDKRMTYLEKCADILDDIKNREAAKRRCNAEKPE